MSKSAYTIYRLLIYIYITLSLSLYIYIHKKPYIYITLYIYIWFCCFLSGVEFLGVCLLCIMLTLFDCICFMQDWPLFKVSMYMPAWYFFLTLCFLSVCCFFCWYLCACIFLCGFGVWVFFVDVLFSFFLCHLAFILG